MFIINPLKLYLKIKRMKKSITMYILCRICCRPRVVAHGKTRWPGEEDGMEGETHTFRVQVERKWIGSDDHWIDLFDEYKYNDYYYYYYDNGHCSR